MKNLLIIPTWLQETLGQRQLKLSDSIDETILMSRLSESDVSFYIYVNMNSSNNTNELLPDKTLQTVSREIGLSDESLDRLKSGIESIKLETQIKPYSVLNQLFDDLNSDDNSNYENIGFEIKELNENTIGLLPFYDKNGNQSIKDTRKNLIKALSKYYKFEDLVNTTFFKQYLVGI